MGILRADNMKYFDKLYKAEGSLNQSLQRKDSIAGITLCHL
ncbi:hypothetical protein [Metabacillus fastidiosus]|uniref:Uncharacterized protein n=1 Tax=Metabacillus fastidiosus TaxID=1458 RepID=A0ABU6NWM2_9BACI|nr:hypothetical protein [Metabacillus fastidiosus]